MRAARPNDLGRGLLRFFQEYLPNQRGMSQHTIHSYRDAVVLFLQFVAQQTRRGVEGLGLDDFHADHVTHFLASLEAQRGNGVATRNARLSALHTLSRYLVTEYPAHTSTLQAVLAVPFKRGARNAPIEYLDQDEVTALLASIDRSGANGRRDYALFALMFNTGARVQEILDIRPCDVRLDPPYQVRLQGKGKKTRVCPIWANTARLLRPLCEARIQQHGIDALFVNRHGQPLTRFGVRYLLNKHMETASVQCPTLSGKLIHPHSIRHSTAIHMLKAGVDFASISQWLGHANLNTTMIYARTDIDLKRQALTQVFPEALAPTTAGAVAHERLDIVSWLRRL